MKIIEILICSLILTTWLSCSNLDKSKQTEIKLESCILTDIMTQVITPDSFDLVFPIFPPPPPPSAEIIQNGKSIINRVDSNVIKEYNSIISKINTNRFVYSIEDSSDMSIIDTAQISSTLKTEHLYELYGKLINNCKNNQSKIPIELTVKNKFGKYELIKRSQILPNDYNFRKYKKLDLTYYYFGNLIFSKPFLDTSRETGFIVCMRNCGFECDKKYLILIRKINSKWTVQEKIRL